MKNLKNLFLSTLLLTSLFPSEFALNNNLFGILNGAVNGGDDGSPECVLDCVDYDSVIVACFDDPEQVNCFDVWCEFIDENMDAMGNDVSCWDDCEDYYNPELDGSVAWCETGDDGGDDGDDPYECIMDCEAIDTIGEDSNLEELCGWLEIIDESCLDDCDFGPSELFGGECECYQLSEEECSETDACAWYADSEGNGQCSLDGDDNECSGYDSNWSQIDGIGNMEHCHSDAGMAWAGYHCDAEMHCVEPGCYLSESGDIEWQDYCNWDGINDDFECFSCHNLCEMYCNEDCDIDACHEDCNNNDCVDGGDDGEDGPPECILDCPDIDILIAFFDYGEGDLTPDDICNIFSSWAGNLCLDDCIDENGDAVDEASNEIMDIIGVCSECLNLGNCEDVLDDSDDGHDCDDGGEYPPEEYCESLDCEFGYHYNSITCDCHCNDECSGYADNVSLVEDAQTVEECEALAESDEYINWEGYHCDAEMHCVEPGCYQFNNNIEWQESSDNCIDSGDDGGDGGDGPPECMMDCEAIDTIGEDSNLEELCGWLEIIDESCLDDCDFGPSELFGGECECYQLSEEECSETDACAWYADSEGNGQCSLEGDDDDCHDLSQEECEESPNGCGWSGSYCTEHCDDCECAMYSDQAGCESHENDGHYCYWEDNLCHDEGGDGPPECIFDCPDFQTLMELFEYNEGDLTENNICEIFISWDGDVCMDDCPVHEIEWLNEIIPVCTECLAAGSCEGLFGDECDDCHDDCYENNDTPECHDNCNENYCNDDNGCADGEISCLDGSCISQSQMCDGNLDCEAGFGDGANDECHDGCDNQCDDGGGFDYSYDCTPYFDYPCSDQYSTLGEYQVSSLDECESLCEGNSLCNAITLFFSESEYPLCRLFSDCSETYHEPGTNPITVAGVDCFEGEDVECEGENIVDCNGSCADPSWLGNDLCEDPFNCEIFAFDGGDCSNDDCHDLSQEECEESPNGCGWSGSYCTEHCDDCECAMYSDQAGCESHENDGHYCYWEDNLCHDEGGDGPPECIFDCPDYSLIEETGPEDIGADAFCTIISGWDSDSCLDDCDAETLSQEIAPFISMCLECLDAGNCEDMFDDDGEEGCEPCDGADGCGHYYSEDECLSEGCDWYGQDGPNCEECEPCNGADGCGNYYSEDECLSEGCDWEGWQNGPGCSEDGGDDGPPECILDCAGIDEAGEPFDPGFCDWFIGLAGDECFADCDGETLDELDFIYSECEEIIGNYSVVEIYYGEMCTELGYEPLDEQQCIEYANSVNVPFCGTFDAGDSGESGCLNWGDCFEFLVNSEEQSCVISTPNGACYCMDTNFNEGMLGDVNNDQELNILDVVLIVNLILDLEYLLVADINEDDVINILDVVRLVNIILAEE